MIRPARPSDAAAIETLAAAYHEELQRAGRAYHGADAAAWRAWLNRRLSAGDVRVALSDTRPVGYAIWELRRAPAGQPGRALHVTDLFVTPGDRGQRFGGGLLARALDRARVDGLATVAADAGLDERGQALLDAFGFGPADEQACRWLAVR